MSYRNERNEPDFPATTPPIAPTEPSPIPIPPTEEELESDGFMTDDSDDNDPVTPRYYCPMRCEGDKTYSAPGNCQICGMTLKQE